MTIASRRPSATTLGAVLALLLGVVLLPAVSPPAHAQEVPVVRIQGGTPVQDAVAWSQATFAAGAADVVLVTRDDDFADALATGFAQHAVGGPLLLTPTASLAPEAAEEVQRLGASRAVVVGGTAAVSAQVAADLSALGLQVERIEGPTRLETAVAVQQRFAPDATSVVLARAFGTAADPTAAFADTLAVGGYAAVSARPILLTDSADLSGPTAAALSGSSVEEVVIAGGTAAVSDDVAAQVRAIRPAPTEEAAGLTVRRVSGATRFATATAVAADLGHRTAASAGRVILVEGQADDAWTGGLTAAAQAGNDAPIVLANGDAIPDPTFDFLAAAGVPLLCGPNVTDTACDTAAAVLRGEGRPDGEPSPVLTVAPQGEQTAAVDDEGGPTGTPLDVLLSLLLGGSETTITSTATGLDPAQAYRVTLVVADNLTLQGNGRATFVDADDSGTADAGASEEIALITAVNGEAVADGGAKTVPGADSDPADPQGIFPDADGTIEVTIDGVAPGTVHPVFYVNAGGSTFLEVDGAGVPVEAHGVGGAATFE